MSIIWETDTLTPGLKAFPEKLNRAAGAVADYHASRAMDSMRSDAPWTDRSGNARNGLFARRVPSTNKIVIVLFHSVPYGFWLETRWSGKYRVIVPTMRKSGRELMTDLRGLMRRMR